MELEKTEGWMDVEKGHGNDDIYSACVQFDRTLKHPSHQLIWKSRAQKGGLCWKYLLERSAGEWWRGRKEEQKDGEKTTSVWVQGRPSILRSRRGVGAIWGDQERQISEVRGKPGGWCHKSQKRLAFQGGGGHSCGMLPRGRVKWGQRSGHWIWQHESGLFSWSGFSGVVEAKSWTEEGMGSESLCVVMMYFSVG